MPDWAALANFVIGPGGALALAIFVIVALVKGWLVPGFIYDRSESRGDKATAALESTGDALRGLTDEIRTRRRGGA